MSRWNGLLEVQRISLGGFWVVRNMQLKGGSGQIPSSSILRCSIAIVVCHSVELVKCEIFLLQSPGLGFKEGPATYALNHVATVWCTDMQLGYGMEVLFDTRSMRLWRHHYCNVCTYTEFWVQTHARKCLQKLPTTSKHKPIKQYKTITLIKAGWRETEDADLASCATGNSVNTPNKHTLHCCSIGWCFAFYYLLDMILQWLLSYLVKGTRNRWGS